jgi:hypothetical protein
MKNAIFVLVMAAGLAVAQEADRITVPFSNPSGPKTVRVDSMHGDIIVRGHAANEVIVETRAKVRGRERRNAREVEGLKRIDIGSRDMVIEERENVVTVSSHNLHGGSDDITILVPVQTSLRVKTLNSEITVDGVHGDIELNTTNGEVKATNVEGSIIAHSLNGEVTVTLNRYGGKPMSFSTLNGEIDVTLPADIKARFKIKADRGEVYSDFPMTLEPTTQRLEEGDAKSGKYRVRVEKVVFATVNGGGPEIAFTTLNGEIKIRRAK